MSLHPLPHHVIPLPQPLGERVARLQAEARGLALEHVCALQSAMAQVERLANEIASGGESYPAGIRDLARRLAEDSAGRGQTLDALLGRAR